MKLEHDVNLRECPFGCKDLHGFGGLAVLGWLQEAPGQLGTRRGAADPRHWTSAHGVLIAEWLMR